MSTMETAPYQIVVLRLEQHHLWLVRPMREWQSLLHKVQMFVPGGGGVSMCLCRCAFRLALLSSARFKIFSSPVFSNFLSMQRTAVCCSVLPNLCIDIQSFHVALADIFISLLRATLEFFAQSKLTVDVFGDSTVFNTAHMAKPAQSGLPEQRVHCKETGAGKNPSVERTLCPSSLGGTKGQIYEGDKEGLLLLPALLL